MDFALWHEQATAGPAPEPAAIAPEKLRRMSETERGRYADQLRVCWRSRPVASPLHDQVAQGMTAALESALLDPAGARTVLSLSAPYTAGKSTMVKRWAQGLYRDWTGATSSTGRPRGLAAPGMSVDMIPICYITLISESRGNDVYAQLMHFARHSTTRNRAELPLRAVEVIRDHQVRLVILDDAHMLRTNSVTGRATLNAIKHLNTELGERGGVLMLVGADLTGGEALSDPQIRGRLCEHTLTPYSIDGPDDRGQWQRFLTACEDRLLPYLPDGEKGLFAAQHAAYIWLLTQGYVGDTTRLLIEATTRTITTGRPFDRDLMDQVPLSQRAIDARKDLLALRKTSSGRRAVG